MGKVVRWSRQEDEAMDRFLSELRSSSYTTARAAAAECWRRLNDRRLRSGDGQSAFPSRTRKAVYRRMIVRARITDSAWCRAWWSTDELRVVKRYGCSLAGGRYAELLVAAKECREELARLALRRPGVSGARTLGAICIKLGKVAHSLGWSSHGRRLGPEEDHTIERHSRALVRGRHVSQTLAARACMRDLAKLYRAHPAMRPMTFKSVKTYIARRAHASGMPLTLPPWTAREDAVVESYARKVLEGNYPSAQAAAIACVRVLARSPGLDRARGRLTRQRTVAGVRARIRTAASRLGHPRPNACWTEQEESLLERHASGVLESRHRSAQAAARACYRDLVAYFRRLRETHGLKAVAGRSFKAVAAQVHKRVRELGRCGTPNRPWSQPEKRLAAQWLRWYDRHHGLGRAFSMKAAAEGLQQDIEGVGGVRTVEACRSRLRQERLRALGMA
jgi:hypothetical protein